MSALIDVRMCDDPACEGWNACPQTRTSKRTMGLRIILPEDASEGRRLAILRQEIYLGYATTAAGTQYWVPDGCVFIAHEVERGEAGVHYSAVLAGPDADLDALLDGAALPDAETAQERLERLNAEMQPA